MMKAKALSLSLLLTSGFASAQTAWNPPDERLLYRTGFFARGNPLGLINETRGTYRRRLYDHPSVALKDNFWAAGAIVNTAPSFARGGALVEIQPASFAQLYGAFEAGGIFGNFNQLQSFPSPNSEATDEVLRRRGALKTGHPLRPYPSTVTQLTLGAILQAKVGPFAVKSNLRFIRETVQIRPGDTVFYDPLPDGLVGQGTFFAMNDLDAVWISGAGPVVGLRWSLVQFAYGPEHFAAGEVPVAESTGLHRLGPLFAWSFAGEDGSNFQSPTAILMLNWHLSHRYRTGVETSQAIPMIAAGFSFTGDLFGPTP